MKDLPNPFWACILVFMACVLGIAALFSHSSNAVAVITMGTSIVTGAFGFIVGHALGSTPTDTKTTIESSSGASGAKV